MTRPSLLPRHAGAEPSCDPGAKAAPSSLLPGTIQPPWRVMHWRCACAPSRRAGGGAGPPFRPRWPSSGRRSSRSSTSRSTSAPTCSVASHASANDLFTVTLPKDGLGFTYPPFSALLFAPFAHLPLRVCEVAFSLCQPRRRLRPDRRQPARRVRGLRPAHHPVVVPGLGAAGRHVRPGAPDLPPRPGQHHPRPHGRGGHDAGPAAARGASWSDWPPPSR